MVRRTPIVLLLFVVAAISQVRAQQAVEVDTALILAVDISNSVDAERYRLQMEGIARALEDQSVIATITGGARGGIALALVEWADTAEQTLPWQLIRSESDARNAAGLVRQLAQRAGEYTCVSRMLAHVSEKVLDTIPVQATRVVVDVSGDGIDNCRDPAETKLERDGLVARGVQINALPIIVEGENEVVGAGAYRAPGFGLGALRIGPGTYQTTLDRWFTEHVIGGPGGFVIPAKGFEDFGRAFRQKFVQEISGATLPRDVASHVERNGIR